MLTNKGKKFSLWRNFNHSINGIVEVTKNETPMKVEVVSFVLFSIVLFFLNISLFYKLILFTSLFLPIFAEIINSAIERVVDLVTLEYHELAKHAKDAASAGVLIALIITSFIWITTLLKAYEWL